MIKAELTLDTTLYQYTVPKGGGGKLVFKAEVDDFTAWTELLETIKRVPVLMNVSEKSSNQKPGSKKIDYVIHAELNQQYDLSSTL